MHVSNNTYAGLNARYGHGISSNSKQLTMTTSILHSLYRINANVRPRPQLLLDINGEKRNSLSDAFWPANSALLTCHIHHESLITSHLDYCTTDDKPHLGAEFDGQYRSERCLMLFCKIFRVVDEMCSKLLLEDRSCVPRVSDGR